MRALPHHGRANELRVLVELAGVHRVARQRIQRIVLEHEQPQDSGPCRDVNFDPTVLPAGIAISDDPLLAARSAVYADSHLRRTREEARVPGAASTADAGMESAR